MRFALCSMKVTCDDSVSSGHEVSAKAESLEPLLFSDLLSERKSVARTDIITRPALSRSRDIAGTDGLMFRMAIGSRDFLLRRSRLIESCC